MTYNNIFFIISGNIIYVSSSIGIYCRCGIYIMGVKAMVGSTLDLISLFNILASTCLAHVAETSIYMKCLGVYRF